MDDDLWDEDLNFLLPTEKNSYDQVKNASSRKQGFDDDLWDEDLDCVPSTDSFGKNQVQNARSDRKSGSKHDEAYKSSSSWRNYRSSNNGKQRTYRNSYQNNDSQQLQNSSSIGDKFNKMSPIYNQQIENRPENATDVVVDHSFAGQVIGRGGSRILGIQKKSGAHISQLKDFTESNAVLRLVGSQEARDKAIRMIEDIITEWTSSPSNFISITSKYTKPPASEPDFDWEKLRIESEEAERKRPPIVKDFYKEEPDFDWEKLRIVSEEAERKRSAAFRKRPPIVKDFYKEDPAVAAMTQKEVDAFRSNNNSISVMKVDPEDDRKIPNPVTSFKQAFQHYPELLDELRKQGFSTPSPIQCQAWPIIMKGYDLIGIAQTGTGKTITSLFPALIHVVGQVTSRSERVGPSVLVLAPTRELALQIEAEAKKYTYRGITSTCIYGGDYRLGQIGSVVRGVDIVIATPGRLFDLIKNLFIDVYGVTYLVLDEADRMLHPGFEDQIRRIVQYIRPDRQTIMTSATWTDEVQKVAARYLTNPMKVNVGTFDLAAVHTVTQEIIVGNNHYVDRWCLLNKFLHSMGPEDKAIVFVDRKSIADDISSDLVRFSGITVQSIHGNREQSDREQALDDFKTGLVKILIATDVASRGLDIKDITHIFNLYFPHNIEEYVHRVGRTGRAGKTGKAISFFTRKDWMHAGSLIKILKEADQFVPRELYKMHSGYEAWKQKKTAEHIAGGGGRCGRNRFNRY